MWQRSRLHEVGKAAENCVPGVMTDIADNRAGD